MKNHRIIRVLVADDHPVVLEGLCSLIARADDMKVVATAASGREAFEQFLRHKPDVALIDLRMPEMSGIDAIAAIRGRIPSAQAIVLTTYTGEEDVYQSLRAGAKGYLLKDAPREDLLGCIRAVHEGRTWISPQAAAHLRRPAGRAGSRARRAPARRPGLIRASFGPSLRTPTPPPPRNMRSYMCAVLDRAVQGLAPTFRAARRSIRNEPCTRSETAAPIRTCSSRVRPSRSHAS